MPSSNLQCTVCAVVVDAKRIAVRAVVSESTKVTVFGRIHIRWAILALLSEPLCAACAVANASGLVSGNGDSVVAAIVLAAAFLQAFRVVVIP